MPLRVTRETSSGKENNNINNKTKLDLKIQVNLLVQFIFCCCNKIPKIGYFLKKKKLIFLPFRRFRNVALASALC